MSDRDTHFAGFAKLLYEDFLQLREEDESSMQELLAPDYFDKWRVKVEQRIAKRAYDLAYHVLMHTTPASGSTIRKLQGLSIEEIAGTLPDLTEWPVEPPESM